ncbi:MAG TPA: hypothetical protein VG367_18185 [Mucilaginibacter sp.]|nr:hypothetical protein [Mucilaginibacter sp.]
MAICLNAFAQSPEISLREFASGQIKKGVRSIGMGGDGATWGNYALVWRDSSTALVDVGNTHYTNGNNFSFNAVGVTTPALWHGMTVYVIALSQNANDISAFLKSPGLGPVAVPTIGNGDDQAFFLKTALPLNKQFSFGVMLSYERSQYDAVSDNIPNSFVRYQTNWKPSGGFGLTYQPSARFLFGFRALFNQDLEKRIDNSSSAEGFAGSQEYRFGASMGLWKGALMDVGGNIRSKQNDIAGTSSSQVKPNIGFEQNLWNKHFALRAGLDETSKTGGFTLKFQPFNIDVAYVNNIGIARVGNLFGNNSNSLIATVVFNYGNYISKRRSTSK